MPIAGLVQIWGLGSGEAKTVCRMVSYQLKAGFERDMEAMKVRSVPLTSVVEVIDMDGLDGSYSGKSLLLAAPALQSGDSPGERHALYRDSDTGEHAELKCMSCVQSRQAQVAAS